MHVNIADDVSEQVTEQFQQGTLLQAGERDWLGTQHSIYVPHKLF